MNDESLEVIERQIVADRFPGAPAELRGAVLRDVQRELRAASWDRRLARAAVVMLVAGVGVNVAMMLPERMQSTGLLATTSQQDALAQVAASVAEATNMQTGRQVARSLAAMTGRPLNGDEAAAIDAAVERTSHGPFVGKEG